MSLIENAAFFIGGLFFAAAFPQPSAFIRAKVVDWLTKAKTTLTSKSKSV